MPRVPGEATHPEPLDSLGREFLPPVSRGGTNVRPTFTERNSKDMWYSARIDRKGSPGSSGGMRKSTEA